MKRLLIPVTILCAAIAAYPQTPPDDWSWTFLRNGETCGLLFEDIDLTTSAKAAIRDDFFRAYSFVASSNLFIRLYAPGDPEYGTFIGGDGLQGDHGCPYELGGLNYQLHNGNKYLHIEKGLSATYLEKIALTNQHQVAVGNLTNFLNAFNTLNTNSVNPQECIQMWWSVKNEQPYALSEFTTAAEFLEFVAEFCGFEMIVPSITSFRYENAQTRGGLWCKMRFRRKNGGGYEPGPWMDIIYREGKWRMALPEF